MYLGKWGGGEMGILYAPSQTEGTAECLSVTG